MYKTFISQWRMRISPETPKRIGDSADNKNCQKTTQLAGNLVCTKYESYILHTSAVMDTFQNLNANVNDKVWPGFDLGRRSNWRKCVCVLLIGLTLR